MTMICINCPKGCELTVARTGDDVTVKGHTCPRGEAYGRSECLHPTRMVTGLVRVAGLRKPLPVKTKSAIPKDKINDVLFALHQATVQQPVALGDVIIPNVAETGIDVVATANM